MIAAIARPWTRVAVALAFVLGASAARADVPPPMSPRTLALPAGPSAIHGLGESFSPNPSTGAGNFGVDFELPPGLGRPAIALQYTHGHGRSEVGATFHLPRLSVYRTRDKGIPSFTEGDRFAVAGPDVNEELVLVNAALHYYRLRNESGFALFVRDPAADTWTIRYADGSTALLGGDPKARQGSARGAYRWYVSTITDVSGNQTAYDYVTDAGYVYLSDVRYRLNAPGYENRVDFSYETRPDPFTDYGYGSAATCRQRLARVLVSSGCGAGCGRTIRTYKLAYEATTQSFLKTVTEYGEGGTPDVTMPTLTFTYVTPSRSVGAMVTMPESVPLDLVSLGRAQFDDVNGDGLPDLLVGAASSYTYYENVTGASWSAPIALSRSPDVSLDDGSNGAVLVDVDGDGFRDVLRASTAGYTYFPGGNVVRGKLVAYLPPVTLGAPAGAPLWSAAGVRVADLNLDGRIDLLRASGVHSLVDLNLHDAGGERVRESTDKDLPTDVANLFADPSLQMVDFNGDGAQDFVLNEISLASSSRLRVFYGLGNGQFAPFVAIAAPKGNPADFLFGDVNNDGYADLVKYSGQQLTYWLGAGDEKFLGPYGPQSLWAAPDRSDVRAVQLMDMDGSGTSDLVLLTNANHVVYVSFFASPFVGLLSQVDNGMGLVTQIQYRSSTDYAVGAKLAGTPWRTTLPRPVAVVSQVTATDSLDKVGLTPTVKRTTYEYSDGYYAGRERELRGFGLVRTITAGDAHDEARVVETSMHLGVDLGTGADEEILKGRVYRTVVKNDAGAVYTSEETKWTRRWLCAEDGPDVQAFLPACAPYPRRDEAKENLVAFATQDWLLKGHWEKTTTPRFTLETFLYDAWGHVARRAADGEVGFAVPHAIGDPVDLGQVDPFVGGDEFLVTTSYVNDTTRWLLGLPTEAATLDARTQAVLASTRTYYDGAPYLGLPLGQATRGKATRLSHYLAQEDRWIDAKRMTLDAFDLVTDELDADGNHRALGYDPTHSFVTSESADVGGGRTLRYDAVYDTALGTMLQFTDPNGSVTQYRYDGLGRLRAIIDPDSTASLPSATFDYTYGTPSNPVSLTVERHLVDRAAGSYRTSYAYSDGEGAKRLTKTLDDEEDAYVASGFALRSASGAEIYHYKDFVSPALGLEAPPASTPVAETFHDALGRPTQTFPPPVDGRRTSTLTTYGPFEVRVFDEADTAEATWLYPAISRVDGLGRIRQKLRYNDAPAPGGGTQRAELAWSYTYDPLGNLVSWTDPGANLREYSYDSISRLTDVRDRAMGAIHYVHDDQGNVVARVDALGQARRFTYGAGNRLERVRVEGDAHGAAPYEYAFHYDVAAADGPLPAAANLLGKVAWAEWPAGASYKSYDRLGRAVTEVESLWNPATSTFDAQVRDVARADHAYNAAGWRTHLALPGGRGFGFGYGARGSVRWLNAERGGVAAPAVTDVAYTPEGQAWRTTAANRTVACAWFDDRTELVAQAAGPAATVACEGDPSSAMPDAFQHLVYARDLTRDVTKVTDASVAGALPRLDTAYTYDRLQELTSVVSADGVDTFGYDRVQNVTLHDSTVASAFPAPGDLRYGEGGAAPTQLTSAGGASYSYDSVGNLTSYNGYDLAFDAENHLVRESRAGGETVRHYYDGAGDRRITTIERPGSPLEVHRFVFHEYEERAGVATWSSGAGRVQVEIRRAPGAADETTYVYRDHLAGASHVTDERGALVGFQRYGAYGDLTSRVGAAPLEGYAGSRNEPDEGSGLVQFGARFYAPGVGRWVSADAFIGETPIRAVEKPLEAGLYGYVANDPINRTDPTGTDGRAVNQCPNPTYSEQSAMLPPVFKKDKKDAEYLAFKQRVYYAYYDLKRSQHLSFNGNGVPDTELREIGGSNGEGPFRLRADAAAALEELKAAARRDKIDFPEVASAYRSPGYDFGLWDKDFSGYYNQAVKAKEIKRGDYSDAAVDAVLTHMRKGKAMPGFSNHTNGVSIDIGGGEKGDYSTSVSLKAREAKWEGRPLYDWMMTKVDAGGGKQVTRAETFGFKRLASEPWHFDYRGKR